MNCPLCEAPVFENMRTPCEKFDGLWYHAACLYEERPDLDPNREPEEESFRSQSGDSVLANVQDQARAVK